MPSDWKHTAFENGCRLPAIRKKVLNSRSHLSLSGGLGSAANLRPWPKLGQFAKPLRWQTGRFSESSPPRKATTMRLVSWLNGLKPRLSRHEVNSSRRRQRRRISAHVAGTEWLEDRLVLSAFTVQRSDRLPQRRRRGRLADFHHQRGQSHWKGGVLQLICYAEASWSSESIDLTEPIRTTMK